MRGQDIQKIKINDLKLWSENPRDPLTSEASDFEIISNAITENKNKWNLQKLMGELGEFYDYSELPIVVEVNGQNIVYDGNRRVALIKYLQNEKKYIEKGAKLKHKNKQEFIDLKKIPCNICSLDIALDSIERKHTNGGTWNELEREYFKYIHRKEVKSLFISLEEATGIISNNPKLNQRFVKEEVLTRSNLESIGIGVDKDNNLFSIYDTDFTKTLFNEINEAINNKDITTRHNRGKIKEVLSSRNSDIGSKLKNYDRNLPNKSFDEIYNYKRNTTDTDTSNIDNKAQKSVRGSNRTPVTTDEDILFGKKLILKESPVNDIYRAIEKIYNTNKNSKEILPIIAMSLRLILEVGARIYYDEHDPNQNKKDQLLKGFLDIAKKEMKIDSTDKNYLALTSEWLDTKINLEAILAKYAHGSISYDKGTILKHSIIVGEIIAFYFKKD